MSVLTETDLEKERARRASSNVPELDDIGDYRPGHIDFTAPGYALFREVTKEIQGEAFLVAQDCGFNLDIGGGRFDFYSVRREDCDEHMKRVRAEGDSYTGIEGTTFVGADLPVEIGAWRPTSLFSLLVWLPRGPSIHERGARPTRRSSGRGSHPPLNGSIVGQTEDDWTT